MNTSIETCPSLEDLAAFLEGKLTGDERARIVAHLADCPDCYEIFAEAARFELSEEEKEYAEEAAVIAEVPREPLEDPPAGKVIPFTRRTIFRWVSSIAAALAVVALSVPLYQQYYTTPELKSQELVSSGLSGKAAQDVFWSQWVNRGTDDNVSIVSPSHEFLLGAHLVDLRLSLLRKDTQAADDALARINGHLDELGSRNGEAASFYASAREKLWHGQLPQDFLLQAERMEASLRPEEYPYLAFGKWTEAGRLSALNQDPDFFQDPENRKFLRAFLHQEKELESEVEMDLKEIRKTFSTADPSSLPYQEFQQQFEKILTFYQNKSKEQLVPADPSPAP